MLELFVQPEVEADHGLPVLRPPGGGGGHGLPEDFLKGWRAVGPGRGDGVAKHAPKSETENRAVKGTPISLYLTKLYVT